MPEHIEEVRAEMPAMSVQLTLHRAVIETIVAWIAVKHGRKEALQFASMLEDVLTDAEAGENVVRIRGEDARATVRRNQRAARNWVQAMMPVFVRRLGR